MAELEHQILAVIQSQLPEQTAGVLRGYLESTKDIRKELETEQKKVERLEENLRVLKSRYEICTSELEFYKKREESLQVREKKVLDTEITQKVSELTIQLEAQKTINTQIYALTEKVFRNPVMVKSGSGRVPVIHQGTSHSSGWTEERQVDTVTRESLE